MARHFLVVGAQRCGTTYLRTLLDAHPQIAMAEPTAPEPKVFLDDEVIRRGAGWYRQTFFPHAAPGQLLGEKSTSYLEVPSAARRAADVLGDVRILVQLRDPVARAVSNWRFSREHGVERRTLAKALTENLAGPTPWDPERTSVSPFAYLERGRYADYLAGWYATFGDRVRVQYLEDLLAQPDAVGETYAWLGVDPSFRPSTLGETVNPSASSAPSLEPGLLGRLREWFAGSDRALAAMVGRPAPWTTQPLTSKGAS